MVRKHFLETKYTRKLEFVLWGVLKGHKFGIWVKVVSSSEKKKKQTTNSTFVSVVYRPL